VLVGLGQEGVEGAVAWVVRRDVARLGRALTEAFKCDAVHELH